VADDLGFSDIGSFGGEIETPVLDRLASEDLRLSNFHVLPTCSPTRAALLTGNDNHVAGMGVMGEFIYPAIEGLPGYAGHLADQVATLPEVLGANGYRTYMAGKWHLGHEDEQSPFSRGFGETFTLMDGGGSHFADQRPLSPGPPMLYRKNGRRVTELPDDFYSTKNYTDSLIAFLDRDAADRSPFFAYLSYTAPHDPLHAPDEYIAKYRGRYDEGFDALRLERLEALKTLRIVQDEMIQFRPNPLAADWSSFEREEQAKLARDMEVYAAMVDYMDMSIGRLLDYLRETGRYHNTLIVFFSDNGANGAPASAYPGNLDGQYLGSFNNSLENRGRPNSFVDMGAGWAQAVSSPFRMYKSFTSEGGIRSPLIVKLPGETPGAGAWKHGFLHVTDIAPTFFELAGTTYPEIVDGRAVRPPIGRSMIPLLRGEAVTTHPAGMGWELFEMKAFVRDNWKILRMPEPFGSGEWELYDLVVDPGEIKDVSDENRETKGRLLEAWRLYAEQNEVFDHAGHFDAIYRRAYGLDN
jgi:arylsulfatase